jgi:hypothetical protein
MSNSALIKLIEENEWIDIPSKIITREGHIVDVAELTLEHLDNACKIISSHYSEGGAYNLQKIIGEFASHCDANNICKIYLDYKFSGLKRPLSTNGVGYKRLDDPTVTENKCDKLVSSEIFRTLGELCKKYYLKDLLLVRPLGLSSGAFGHWISIQFTHSMMTTFLRYFGDLAAKYASTYSNVSFTSHHFRHTLNTLLDEGGLTDLLQTEWFGRKNPHDTKAYQHTSREKRALILREDIKKGQVGGQIVEKLKSIPITVQDAFLKTRVNAVHDVGSGICIHNFIQTPCERHLQCSADCKDYVWVKDDKGRVDDLKRQYSMTVVARETAEKKSKEKNAKKSIDWLTHNDKKLTILSKQLTDNNISEFDPHQYLEELSNE